MCVLLYNTSYLNATLQPIYVRTDVGLVLALMDMFSCLQQDMTEVCSCVNICCRSDNDHSVAREVAVGCKVCLSNTIRKGSSFGKKYETMNLFIDCALSVPDNGNMYDTRAEP